MLANNPERGVKDNDNEEKSSSCSQGSTKV
jgi:hypothetical protein